MAKKSAIDKNKKRIRMVEQQKDKRAALKSIIKDKMHLKKIGLRLS